jgi:tryptophan 2,3-dioxygenase
LTQEVTYGTYLELEQLLALQHPKSAPEHPDELLFIIVHQASELWFKLILHELNHLSTALERFETWRAIESLGRVNGLMGIVTAQLHALDTLSPQCFAQFRTYLGTSSGSQSIQFRVIELMSGLRAPEFLNYIKAHGPVDPRVQAAMDSPGLPELFDRLLAHYDVAGDKLYSTDDHLDLRMLAEGLLAYEQAFGRWRFIHVQLVERIIGVETGGTGGSLGAKALRATLENRFFPQLWAVRSGIFAQR